MRRNRTRIAERRADATARKELSDKRSPKERLARLNKVFGKNLGAKKERKRLNGPTWG
jgi:hypothetical protein